MKRRTKAAIVINHMFSKKALGYRAFTISWTLIAVMFWNYIYFHKIIFTESLEVTGTIVIGKFLFYGLWEYFHLKEVDEDGVYDAESHERVDQITVIQDKAGRYHDLDEEGHPLDPLDPQA